MVRLLPWLLLGCTPGTGVVRVGTTDTASTTTAPGSPSGTENGEDLDEDGWTAAEGDCADDDPAVHPGATEILGDQIDNDCLGGVYAAPTAYFEVTPADGPEDVATATVVVSYYTEQSEFLCAMAYTVIGTAGSGAGQVPDCPSCNAWLALEFGTAGAIAIPDDPDVCGNTVALEDPNGLGPASGDYWFGGMAFVDLGTMRAQGIQLYGWTADDLAAELDPMVATHIGALRADALTNSPMTPNDQWEAGAWVAVDPTQNPNTGRDLAGQYVASAIYLLMLGD